MATQLMVGERRLEMDGRWNLPDLSGFGRQYDQTYSFLYVLQIYDPDDTLGDERVEYTFRAYPWRGGWSAVDFFQSLQFRVPKRHRPRISKIEYASPGYIELALVVVVAISLRRIIKAVCDSANDINTTYNNIYKGMRDRKLMQIDLRRADLALGKEEVTFLKESADLLATQIKFTRMDKVRQLTPNELIALKVLLSFFRRVRHLAQLEKTGKLKF